MPRNVRCPACGVISCTATLVHGHYVGLSEFVPGFVTWVESESSVGIALLARSSEVAGSRALGIQARFVSAWPNASTPFRILTEFTLPSLVFGVIGLQALQVQFGGDFAVRVDFTWPCFLRFSCSTFRCSPRRPCPGRWNVGPCWSAGSSSVRFLQVSSPGPLCGLLAAVGAGNLECAPAARSFVSEIRRGRQYDFG